MARTIKTIGEQKQHQKKSGHCHEDKKKRIDTMEGKKSRAKNSIRNSLQTIEPEVVSGIEVHNGWEEIFMTVDSSASETVVGKEMLEGVPTMEGEASRRGVQYEVMNGIRIPNLGEKKFSGYTSEGIVKNLTAQVCEVNKALLSVKKVVQAGNKVVFDSDGSFIEDKITGQKLWLKEENGMYKLQMWVRGVGF